MSAFECENEDNTPSNHCEGWGDCLTEGTCILALAMDTEPYDDPYEAVAYNREREEDFLGRPLFPNEY